MDSEHSDDSPNWQLLPDRPLAFFELESGFERTDLKRAYNRWIRRFKPEHAPEEFQRIRAAYEHLDEALRYGMLDDEDVETASFQVESAAPHVTNLEIEPEIEPYPTLARLAEVDPSVVLRELQAFAHKTPANWIQLALLADELTRNDPLILHKTLVQAVRETGGAKEVTQLLIDSCHVELSVSHSAKLVMLLRDLIADSSQQSGFHPTWFFFTTEHLWLEIISKAKFGAFPKLFSRACEGITEGAEIAYFVLLFRLVRHGAYRADPEWIAASLTELAESYHRLPEWLQNEIDVFDWLDSYRSVQAEFIAKHPGRESVGQAVQLIAMGDEVKADRAFLEAQAHALDNRDELLHAFQLSDNVEPALSIMRWYANQIVERGSGVANEKRTRVHATQLREFLYGIEKKTDRSLIGWARNMMVWPKLGLLALLLLLPYGSIRAAFDSQVSPMPFYSLMVIAYGLIVWAWTQGWVGGVLDMLTAPFERRIYNNRWRPAVANFLATTYYPWGELLKELPEFSESGITYNDTLHEYLVSDPGMALYALSLRFAE